MTVDDSTAGVVYVATGPEHLRAEALRSLRSLRRVSPSLPVAVFVDEAGVGSPLWQEADLPAVIEEPFFGFRDKIEPLRRRPFARTLFLDCDTYVVRPLEPLLDLLDAVDVAAIHDTWRVGVPVPVPDAFPEINAGVILFGPGAHVDALIEAWDTRYAQLLDEQEEWDARGRELPLVRERDLAAPTVNDQPGLRWALWDAMVAGTIRFATLPTEANLRLWMPNALAEGAMPWIVHDHAEDLAPVTAALSRSVHARAWVPGLTSGPTGRPTDALVVPGRGSDLLIQAAGVAERARGRLARGIRRRARGSG